MSYETIELKEILKYIELLKNMINSTKNYCYREIYLEELLDMEEILYELHSF